MTMYKRDYAAIARAIYEGTDDDDTRGRMADILSPVLREGNSRFRPVMFRDACRYGTTDPHIVIVNVPGYMPDDDGPAYVASRRDAEQYARDIAREYREEHGHAAVRGNARDGWYVVDDGTPLGVVVSIDRVTD